MCLTCSLKDNWWSVVTPKSSRHVVCSISSLSTLRWIFGRSCPFFLVITCIAWNFSLLAGSLLSEYQLAATRAWSFNILSTSLALVPDSWIQLMIVGAHRYLAMFDGKEQVILEYTPQEWSEARSLFYLLPFTCYGPECYSPQSLFKVRSQ